MTVLTEGNLQIAVNNAVNARKFDDQTHGMSHCMKAVDFVFELADRYLFIEFKDPQHPQASGSNRDEFVRQLRAGGGWTKISSTSTGIPFYTNGRPGE